VTYHPHDDNDKDSDNDDIIYRHRSSSYRALLGQPMTIWHPHHGISSSATARNKVPCDYQLYRYRSCVIHTPTGVHLIGGHTPTPACTLASNIYYDMKHGVWICDTELPLPLMSMAACYAPPTSSTLGINCKGSIIVAGNFSYRH
jgi:hypothetical protein